MIERFCLTRRLLYGIMEASNIRKDSAMRHYPPPLKCLTPILLTAIFASVISLCFCTSPSAPPSTLTDEGEIATTEPSPYSPAPALASLDFVSNGNGTCTVIGIGTHTDQTLIIPTFSPGGDLVTAIAPRAFYGNASLVAIHIPASVTHVGDLAFAASESLSFLSVSADNPSYTSLDGVLYSKDLSSLLLYPPCLGGSVLHIPISVTSIAPMALYRSDYLSSVLYDGSPADWESVSVGSKNYSLSALPVRCGMDDNS
ncbi:MAG: hypothetical protein IJW16_04585 [Clostridia bacterium]|nr:hypothetical protein [Clostridia bacterium]